MCSLPEKGVILGSCRHGGLREGRASEDLSDGSKVGLHLIRGLVFSFIGPNGNNPHLFTLLPC